MDAANIEKNAFSLEKKCSDILAEIRLFRKKQDKFYGFEGPMVKRTHTLIEDTKDLIKLKDFKDEEEEFVGTDKFDGLDDEIDVVDLLTLEVSHGKTFLGLVLLIVDQAPF